MKFGRKECACKGVRSCLVCEARVLPTTNSERLVGVVCWCCRRIKTDGSGDWIQGIYRCENCTGIGIPESLSLPCDVIKEWLYENISLLQADSAIDANSLHILLEKLLPTGEDFGVLVTRDVLTNIEETDLMEIIDSEKWAESQSGRRKQDYGVSINFKKRKVKLDKFSGLPAFAQKYLVPTFDSLTFPLFAKALKDFQIVELCNLEYLPCRGSQIDAHFDDCWIWGARLVTFNFLSHTFYTFSVRELSVDLQIPIPRRSVLVVQGPSRYLWMHSIKREHIESRRVACTLRELNNEFAIGGEEEGLGQSILNIAKSFKGRPSKNSV